MAYKVIQVQATVPEKIGTFGMTPWKRRTTSQYDSKLKEEFEGSGDEDEGGP